MTASIDEFCADRIIISGTMAPDTVRACVDVIENELQRALVGEAIPRPGPCPSSVSLAPKSRFRNSRPRRQRSGRCTTRSLDQAVGFSAKECVGPFPFDSQA